MRHVARLTLGALAEMEAALEAGSLIELVERFEGRSFRTRDVLAVVVAGMIVAIVAVIALLMTRWLRTAAKGTALIVSGGGPTRVVFDRVLAIPVIHAVEVLDLSLQTVVIDRRGREGLHCHDNVRADVRAAFLIRVNHTAEDVLLKVADTIGCARRGRPGGADGAVRRQVRGGAAHGREALPVRGRRVQGGRAQGPGDRGGRARPQRVAARGRRDRDVRTDADRDARPQQHPRRGGDPPDHRAGLGAEDQGQRDQAAHGDRDRLSRGLSAAELLAKSRHPRPACLLLRHHSRHCLFPHGAGGSEPLGLAEDAALYPLLHGSRQRQDHQQCQGRDRSLLGQQSEFVRTPKYGVYNRAEASKKSFHYKAGKSVGLWIELMLAGYFGWLIWLAIELMKDWGAMPFRCLFMFGFLYVASGSLFNRFSMALFVPSSDNKKN